MKTSEPIFTYQFGPDVVVEQVRKAKQPTQIVVPTGYVACDRRKSEGHEWQSCFVPNQFFVKNVGVAAR